MIHLITAQQIAKLINGDLYGDENLAVKAPYDLIPGKKSHFSFFC